MKICFYGVGGVGGYFGALMVNKVIKDNEIYFVARGKHLEQIKTEGLLLKKSGGEEEIVAYPSICTNSTNELPICDIIILSVKSYDLENATMQIEKISNENTIILPLLNGVDISSRIRSHLKTGKVLESCVYVGTHIESPGVIFQKGGSCKIHIGKDQKYPNFKPQKLLDILEQSNINFEWEDDVRKSIWNKFIFIAAYGLMTATYDKTLGEIINNIKFSKLTKSIMQEIKDIALKLDVALDHDIVNTSFEKAKQFPLEAKTSLQRDIESKGAINEGDIFGGTLIRYGKSLKLSTSNIENVYSTLLSRIS